MNKRKENIPIRKRKIIQLAKRKYFQFQLGNWEMAEEEQGKNKRIRPRERACGKTTIFVFVYRKPNLTTTLWIGWAFNLLHIHQFCLISHALFFFLCRSLKNKKHSLNNVTKSNIQSRFVLFHVHFFFLSQEDNKKLFSIMYEIVILRSYMHLFFLFL